VVFCCFGRVTKAYSLCFGGGLAARCGKQLEKSENTLCFSRVSEKMLGILVGSFSCFGAGWPAGWLQAVASSWKSRKKKLFVLLVFQKGRWAFLVFFFC
jgi:hypothetical protein